MKPGPKKGVIFSEEHRKNISAAQKGKPKGKHPPRSAEWCRHISEAAKASRVPRGMAGRKHTEETKLKMAQSSSKGGLDRYVIGAIPPGLDTPCWIWTGAGTKDPDGYGYATVAGRRVTTAHRAMYERVHGPVPRHLDVDHLCRVKLCVNPAHGEAVTRAVNLARARPFRKKRV